MKKRLAKKRSKKMLAKIAERYGIKIHKKLFYCYTNGLINIYEALCKDGTQFRLTTIRVKSTRKRGGK